MVTLVRRFLVVAALMFWQGGFTFYSAVVVPVGTEVLGSRTRQGVVTRAVTPYLTLAGAASLVPLAWDAAVSAPRRRPRLLAWAGLLLTLAALFALWPRLDALMHAVGDGVTDPDAFRHLHKAYLWIAIVQWAAGLAYLLLTLQAWRAEDRAAPGPAGAGGTPGAAPPVKEG